MSEPTPELEAAIRGRLDEIKDPCSVAGGTPMGLSEMGLVGSIECDGHGDVQVNLRLTSPFCHMIAFMQAETVEKVGSLPGVRTVTVTGDQGLDWSPSMISAEAQARRERRLQERFARAVGASGPVRKSCGPRAGPADGSTTPPAAGARAGT